MTAHSDMEDGANQQTRLEENNFLTTQFFCFSLELVIKHLNILNGQQLVSILLKKFMLGGILVNLVKKVVSGELFHKLNKPNDPGFKKN